MTRKQRGNMLVLSGVFMTVNAVGLIIASSFGSLYFIHNRLQTTADELALEGARKLNEQDRLGQMNNMIARSRQLVFDTNDSKDFVQESNMTQVSDLADILHEEAREGAMLLESERQKLFMVSKTEATNAITTRFNQIKAGHGLVLPWLQTAVPVTPILRYGFTDKTASNVAEMTIQNELNTQDHSSNYCTTDGSKLYKENIDARLKDSDTDLHFKLSSLPAPVANCVSPARAILAKSFKNEAPGSHLNSTVQVELKMDVDTSLGATAHSTMMVLGTAEATGGQLMQ